MYDYIITKPPLNEDTLAHFGVKGMKWRFRKKAKKAAAKKKYITDHLVDDYLDGKIDKLPGGINKNGTIYPSLAKTTKLDDKGNKWKIKYYDSPTNSSDFRKLLEKAKKRKESTK